MSSKDIEAWLKTEGIRLFTQTVLDELYAIHLFRVEQIEGRAYNIPREERHDIVILVQQSHSQEYKATRYERTDRPHQFLSVFPCQFWRNVYIPTILVAAGDYRNVKEEIIGMVHK
jgi:hypothetical protein